MAPLSSSSPSSSKPKAAAADTAAEQTVFVRWTPASVNIRRHHLEDLFSQIGPIRKSSIILPRQTKDRHQGNDDDDDNYNRQQENLTDDKPAASYGFIKYTTPYDAKAAAAKLDHSSIRLSKTEVLKLRVERASDAARAAAGKHKNSKSQSDPSVEKGEGGDKERSSSDNTKRNRVILRNLSFYAKESHVRKELEARFGKVLEVHIPEVPNANNNNNNGDKTTHRGFCFVTFEKHSDAQACIKASNCIMIQKRAVTAASALNKTQYEHNKLKAQQQNIKKSQEKKDHNEENEDTDEKAVDGASNAHVDGLEKGDDDDDDGMPVEASDPESDQDEGDGNDGSDHSDTSVDDGSDVDNDENKHILGEDQEGEKGKSHSADHDDSAVAERRALFVRNLPFDATRHDLFELFHKFGFITGIFLVKDRETNIPKGTAFVSFRDKEAVDKALELARQEKFISQREATENQIHSELTIRGRQIFISLAVDKNTASTLVMEKSADRNMSGKDRRNLYLKGEGRVDNVDENDTAWNDLPERDKNKRQRAWSDKNTKLRSPIFFINPTRLSIRNLAKHVDEQMFKKLCVDATRRGLERGLVKVEDVIAHWRASGEMTTRDIMERVETEGNNIILPFDEMNVKKHIPSVFIDRDVSGNKKTGAAPSRGFGFVEFEHHAHALACLREMNNNVRYSQEFAAGGQHAYELRKNLKKRKKPNSENDYVGSDGLVKLPRLIVEFTVENRSKARQQAEHRAQQQANKIKQKMENKEKSNAKKKTEKKKSRGARQRERKRKGLHGEGADSKKEKAATRDAGPQAPEKVKDQNQESTKGKPKSAKPQKKRKIDAEETNFDKMVASYENSFADAAVSKSEASNKAKKRWFED